MSHFHRRNSSAAAQYHSITPQPGIGDITDELESYSSATPRPRTGSFAAEQKALEELEEKEGFIPREAEYDLPGARRKKVGKKKGWLGWKSKLVLTALVGGGIGAGVYYLFFWDGDLSSLWGGTTKEEIAAWEKAEFSSASKAVTSAATGVKNYAHKATASATSTTRAYDDEYPYDFDEEETSSTSSYTRPTASTSSSRLLASTINTTRTSFSSADADNVAELLDNGTLAAYKWHETVPSLNSSSPSSHFSTLDKIDGGRLIIVGDLHGTHHSLARLLKRLSFSPASGDTLLHTGDILGKSPLNDSLTTVSLLRQLGAKGVRGNHDQKVIEWRRWMEAYGPLSSSLTSSSVSSSPSSRAASSKAQSGYRGSSGFRKVPSSHHSYDTDEEAAAPRGRHAKRRWLDWLTGGDGDAGSEELLEAQTLANEEEYGTGSRYGAAGGSNWAAEHRVQDGPSWVELGELEEELSSSSSTSAASASASKASKSSAPSTTTTTTTGGRRPFGRPTTLSSSFSASSSSSTGRYARPSSSSSASRPASFAASSSSDGTLLGPSYAWLSPSLSSSDLSKLGVEVPEGWEWGGEHFEIARHLGKEDAEYLESLPLTLWVEEVKSWVVHAGMVPWASLSTTLSKASSASSSSASTSVPSVLTSTSPLEFSPSTSLSRLLSRSPLTSLLLEPLNTSPFTLLNMRTLQHSSSGRVKGSKVKGPASEWTVSSKGRKAGAGSKPWWSVWEAGMKECGNMAGKACEAAGIFYGHWAGQGLQVQDHSIGLDSGCVYGRRLSALVIDLSSHNSSSSASSAAGSFLKSAKNVTSFAGHRLLNSTSSKVNATFASLSSSAKNRTSSLLSDAVSEATSTSTRAKANWHGGMNKVTKSLASASSSSTSTSTGKATRPTTTTPKVLEEDLYDTSGSISPDDAASSSSSYYNEEGAVVGEENEKEEKPWWRPWKRSLEERAPPQGRPGVASWQGQAPARGEQEEEEEGDAFSFAAEDEEDAYEGEYAYDEDEEASSSVFSTSTTVGRKGKPTSTSSPASASSTSTTKGGKGAIKSSSSSLSSTRTSPSSFASSKSTASSSPSVLELEDEDESDEVSAIPEEEEEEEEAYGFEQQQVVLKQAGGLKAVIMSVDCAGEADIE
ncbi:hypothetical protein JCM8547_000034 [Rhodosporidiobolus lusitaniae]